MEVALAIVGGKHAGTKVPVAEPKFLIGRAADCHLRLQSTLVSRKHCLIELDPSGASIEDCGSTNGTFVNGERLTGRQPLRSGDRIKIGELELEAQLLGAAPVVKKPKVHEAPKPVIRATAKASGGDDFDISDWLEEEDTGLASPPRRPASTEDTSAGRNMIDTVNIPAPAEPKTQAIKPESKVIKPSKRNVKPTSESSRAAADDMLRQFLSHKPKP